ncbi:ubiquitin carboxyl-terminal hydrolase 40-like isoform X1 [Apostichopus japonicus]|uniref:ubiquitin carboxyl-terminal hydrolase 40-like isoform X1 n=1 Tax=Stichopus japonicus TaxID=307972 RepID=UPI003AB48F53
MLDLLFEDEDENSSQKPCRRGGGGGGDNTKISGPPAPKNPTGLAGIDNRGATCYLNSLLQTLLLTPELREALFCLGPDELGNLGDKDNPGAKVRVIPIELQRLFARLLFQNQDSCSTDALTSSFGWNSNEHFQQHDIQELNRILFSALEDSLVGTSGQNVISELYHGTIVNRIVCDKCGKVSEREEDFLDLTLPITGYVGVSDTLRAMYAEVELMKDSNQYRCSSCQILVDAKKDAKLRKLPPILTLSLLRFSYDFQRGERYKETNHYTFPLELDMTSYCEESLDDSDGIYELFSVVIHSGSTHGGHYRAYIRDVDGIGNWSAPEESPITIKSDPQEGKVDFIEISSPQQLLKTLLQQYAADGSLPVDKLCQVLMKETGVSWNKRFKRQYGSITKFLKRYNDIFIVDPVSSLVSLKDPFDIKSVALSSPSKPSNASPDHKDISSPQVAEIANSQESLSTPAPGYGWFDFNDSRVQPIHDAVIQSKFAGRESAYMLFYRKKNLQRKPEEGLNHLESLPMWLHQEIQESNEELTLQRDIYDLTVNEIKVHLLFPECYEWSSGALQVKRNSDISPKCISLDRRKTIADLKQSVQAVCDDQVISPCCLHIAKELPAGLHLYDCISEQDSSTIRNMCITDGSYLFVWDGKQVDGMPIRTGLDAQPIFLRLSYLSESGDRSEISRGYPRDTSMRSLFEMLSVLTDIPEESLNLQRMAKDGQLVMLERKDESIFEEGLEDEDNLVAEMETSKDNKWASSSKQLAPVLKENLQNQVHLTAENRCVDQGTGEEEWPAIQINTTKDKTVAELKQLILFKFSGEALSPDSTRLRVEDDNLGLQPPLHEDQTIQESIIKRNSHLVLEMGSPPKNNEISVTFALNTEQGTKTWELLLNRNLSCAECLEKATVAANLENKDYHLCRTNWFWEEQNILTELDHSLEEENIQDGDHLLLKEGRLPPKGYIRCQVWLYPTPQQGFLETNPQGTSDQAPWMHQQSQEILQTLLCSTQTESDNALDITSHHALLGSVEVSRDDKVDQLKMQILTLPSLAEICAPSVHYLRIRLVVKGRLGKVLDGDQTLKQVKVTSTSHLAVQLLPYHEQLSPSAILLHVCQRIPNTRMYSPVEDFVWDTTGGPSPEDLTQALSIGTSIPVDRLLLAKKLPDKYDWLIILSSAVMGERGKKGKKKGKPKVFNLKQGPYSLRDGDVIAVKDLEFDPLNQDDFTTEEDDIGKWKLHEEVEEKKRMRKEKKNLGADGGNRNRRQEVGLSIMVEDFSR